MHRLGRVLVGTRIALLSLAALVEATPARAHHGKDFLLVETYEIPHPRQAYFISSQDLVREEGLDHLSASPGVLVGVGHPLAFELHAHIEKAPDEGWRYEAIARAIRLQLTPEESGSPLRVGSPRSMSWPVERRVTTTSRHASSRRTAMVPRT